MLATDVKASSLFGEPKRLIDVDEAVELLTAVMPDLDAKDVRDRLGNKKRGFAWLKREITAKQQQDIYRLGIPGIGFLNENKRDYPDGTEISHLIGLVNVDNQGIAGGRNGSTATGSRRSTPRARDRPAAGAGAARNRSAGAARDAR